MGRMFSRKTPKDTEFAAESIINPSLSGSPYVKVKRLPLRDTISFSNNQPEIIQIDDTAEKKN